MTTKTKQTREEKLAAAEADRRASRIAEFRTGFLRDARRRVWTREASWSAEAAGDRSGFAITRLVSTFTQLTEQLQRELVNMRADAEAAQARLADNRDPFWGSNGICAKFFEIDKYAHQLTVLREAIAAMGRATNWRVREIEPVDERAQGDVFAQLDVVQTGGGWSVRRLGVGDEVTAWLRHDGKFAVDGDSYETEDAAWAALAVITTGRAL
jgi:hypothetical protein